MMNVIFFGPPGSGKGTQSKKLSSEYGLTHISFGDILRSHVDNNSAIGLEVKDVLEQGRLVGREIMHRILDEQLQMVIDRKKGFILDGFPRNLEQAKLLEKLTQACRLNISAAFFLDVPMDVVEHRLSKRAETESRKDDASTETIKKRLNVYNNEIESLYSFYKERGKLHHIDGSSNADVIFGSIKKALAV